MNCDELGQMSIHSWINFSNIISLILEKWSFYAIKLNPDYCTLEESLFLSTNFRLSSFKLKKYLFGSTVFRPVDYIFGIYLFCLTKFLSNKFILEIFIFVKQAISQIPSCSISKLIHFS